MGGTEWGNDFSLYMALLWENEFMERERYHTDITQRELRINTQKYNFVIVPTMQFITQSLAEAILEMQKNNISVFFIGRHPEGLCDGETGKVPAFIKNCQVTSLDHRLEIKICPL